MPTLPPRDSKAFTLLELIVVIVILGILAAIAIPSFQKVIARSQDSSAETSLSALHREASALAAFRGIGAFAVDDVTAAGSDFSAAGAGVHAAGATMVQDTDAAPAASDGHGHVVFRLSSDFSQLGLAMLSESGNCVTSLGTVSGGAATTVHLGAAACDGDLALTGAASAAPAPAPEPVAVSATGVLDTSFSGDGVTTTAVRTDHDYGYGMAVQGDGKIVLVGASNSGTSDDFAAVRYNADGTLDTTFSGDGIVTTSVAAGGDVAREVAVQADGKIVVVGNSHDGATNNFAAVRYNSDGSLDTTFDTDGIVTTAVGAGQDVAESLVLQTDGKIVLAGYAENGAYDFAAVRYNSDGSLDTTFDTDGKVVTVVGAGHDIAKSVALQGEKLVVAGYYHNGTNYDFAAVRYNADGTLDATFDGDGRVVTAIGGAADIAEVVAVQGDGKIVLGGLANNGTNNDFAAVRYNADGTLDTTFSGDGKVVTAVGTSDEGSNDLAVQTDGKLVLVGPSYNGTNEDFAVVRYNADGSLDTTFDTDGIVTSAVGTGSDIATSAAIQADGKIVVGGHSHNGTNNDFAVVRYK